MDKQNPWQALIRAFQEMFAPPPVPDATLAGNPDKLRFSYGNAQPLGATGTAALPPATPMPTAQPTASPQLQAMQRAVAPPAANASGPRNPDFSKKPMSPQVKAAIENAAKEFNIPPGLMYDVGYGESGFRADAKNETLEGQAAGVPVGLFQFTPGTWNQDLANYAKSSKSSFKDFNPQTPREDPVANARAAAYLMSHGQLQRWEASRPNWGRFYSKEELAPYYTQSGGFGNR